MKALGKAVIGGALILSAFSVTNGARGASAPVIVSWDRIGGIVVPGNVVGGITGGSNSWSTSTGHVTVDLTGSLMDFYVTGLVLASSGSIGTSDGLTSVQGTLICDPTAKKPTIIGSPAVPLSSTGDASYFGSISAKSTSCTVSKGLAFLITVPVKPPLWIAYGAVFTSP
jgi:hypothetical protein